MALKQRLDLEQMLQKNSSAVNIHDDESEMDIKKKHQKKEAEKPDSKKEKDVTEKEKEEKKEGEEEKEEEIDEQMKAMEEMRRRKEERIREANMRDRLLKKEVKEMKDNLIK